MLRDMTPDEQKREMARLDWEFHKGEVLDRLRIQESLGQTVLKGLTLTNGGALIALFTLLGNSSAKVHLDMRLLWIAFGLFVVGLVFTLIANVCAYFMQVQFTHATTFEMWNCGRQSLGAPPAYDPAKPMRLGGVFEVAMIATAVVALAAFCIGAGIALAGASA